MWKELDLAKVAVYYFTEATTEPLVAVRKPLDSTFNEKKIKESVTDTGIQKILLNHLCTKEGKPDLAFSAEGIEEMNRNLLQLNNGKSHQPIYKVRVYEHVEINLVSVYLVIKGLNGWKLPKEPICFSLFI